MTTENPYKSPIAETYVANLEEKRREDLLPSRWTRLGASMIDGVLAYAIYKPIEIFLVNYGLFDPNIAEPQEGYLEYTKMSLIYFFAFLVLDSYFIIKNGQTIGKKLLRIKVIMIKSGRHSYLNYVFLRYLSITSISYIPYIGIYIALFGILSIFGREKRCLHDYIAGTKVIHT